MRFSTLTYQTNAVAAMQDLQAALAKTQTQIASGKRLQSAADDPAAMAQVNQLSVAVSASQQYVTNGNAASTGLKQEQQALTDATNMLQSARDLAVQANSPTLSVSNRQAIATQLQQLQQQLVSIANRTDANGSYLFSGYAAGTQPFAQSGTSVAYIGAQGVSQIQISANQSISSGDNGATVFMNVPAGNGTFTTAAGPVNAGTGSIDPGSVRNPASWVPDTYTISFTSATQYKVTNSGGTQVASGTYTSGASIAFNGVQVSISGVPAQNDQFTVAPAGTASVFSTLSSLVTTLNAPGASYGQIATQLATGLQQIDNALNNFNSVQASVAGRINAVTASQSTAQSQQTTLQGTISQLSDLDYATAVTQFGREQISLQAAQQTYASLAKLGLFSYLSGL